MTKAVAWLNAFRLRTLPLALSSIIMGSLLAAFYNEFEWGILIGASITTLFLQILSNLANDYGDTINGADHSGRQGPQRMVQSGAIGLRDMRIAIVVFAILSLFSGLYLIYIAFRESLSFNGILFFLLGIAAIAAAMKYTMGKNPYGYKGMGDIFVLLFFGLVGVGGSFYMHSGWFTWLVLLPAFAVGMLSAGVLNLNNMRDEKSDREARKYTLVVRYGMGWSKRYQFILVIGAILSLLCFVALADYSISHFLFLVALPLFGRHLNVVHKAVNADDFDPELKKLALSTLLMVLLFGVGLII